MRHERFNVIISVQDSAELLAFSRSEGPQLSLPVGFRPQRGALSPWLLIHFHGGGFVAQTSKSHEVCCFGCNFYRDVFRCVFVV